MGLYSIFLLFVFVCSNSICFASEEFVILSDFSGKVIVSEDAKQFARDDDDAISSSSVAESIENSKIRSSSAVISLRCMGVNDINFDELTTKLLERWWIFSGKKLVLDISENGITPNSALLLKRWLDKTEITYINICGNVRCAMRNVRELCNAFMKIVEGSDEASKKKIVRGYTAKMVFLPKYYVWYAQNRVKTYSALCEEEYFPADWAEKHKEYYRVIDKVDDDDIFKAGELKESE